MKVDGNNALKQEDLRDRSLKVSDLVVMGDDHIPTGTQTPLREDAFDLDDEEKMERISYHFNKIMETLGLDLKDESLSGTPQRMARMFVKEVFITESSGTKMSKKSFLTI